MSETTPSVKLTKQHREDALDRMMERRFKAEIEGQWPAWADLARLVYERLYDAPTRKKMNALPAGWLPEKSEIGVQFGGTVTRLQFNGALVNCYRMLVPGLTRPEPVMRRVPASLEPHHYHSIALVLEATEDMSITFDRLSASHKDLREQLQRARNQIIGTLEAFTTSGSLVKAWPEVAPFLPDAPPRQAIAVRRTDLNKMLGLPVETAEVAL